MQDQDALHNIEPSDELKTARRQLEAIEGYRLVNDFRWSYTLQKWCLVFSIDIIFTEQELIPAITQWHLLIDRNYPNGDIWVMPDSESGITSTFQHQEFNARVKGLDWSLGKLCLDDSQGSWGRKQYVSEPRTHISRLKWHVDRCRMWLIAAATETLVEEGDPFELPAFPQQSKCQLIFNEDKNSFIEWKNNINGYGNFSFISLGHSIESFIITEFKNETLETKITWGNYINGIQTELKYGIWVLLNKIPVKKAWQIPENFKDLESILKEQDIDLPTIIYKEFRTLKKQNQKTYFVALGFPVSEKFGQKNELIHWFAFGFPKLTNISGFRSDSSGLLKQQIRMVFQENKKVNWVKTENWNPLQLTNRGRFIKDFSDMKLLLIGAGSVGSVFIQSLIRLGIIDVKILDSDIVQAGNLSRHILTLDSVGMQKAEALSHHLNKIFPSVNSTFDNLKLQDILKKDPEYLKDYDIVIDATGQDDVLKVVSDNLLGGSRFFFASVSTGYLADFFYLYTFPIDEQKEIDYDFKTKIGKWLTLDAKKIKGNEQIIEGIGCWHPLFPARIDDIQMLVGASIKLFERELISGKKSKLTVLQKKYENELFVGLDISEE